MCVEPPLFEPTKVLAQFGETSDTRVRFAAARGGYNEMDDQAGFSAGVYKSSVLTFIA